MATLTRSRTPKRRRDKPPARSTIFRGILIMIVFLLVGYQALRLYNGVPTTNYVKQYVSVPTVGNLLAHDFVRIGGKRVGQVYSVDVGSDGRPRVELQLDPGLELPEDTEVAVRANGLLGARYIELIPGESDTNLAEASTIRGDAESYTNGLPETFEVFDEETRGGLQTSITQLGGGLQSLGVPINSTIKTARFLQPKFQDVAQTILDRQGAAARLFPSLASGFEALETATPYIERVTRSGQAALDPLVSERDAVRQSLEDFPKTFESFRTDLPGGTRLLSSIGNITQSIDTTLTGAPAGLDAIAETFEITPKPLRILETATRRNRLGLAPLAPIRILEPVKPLLPHLNQLVFKNLDPVTAEVSRRGCDIKNFGATMRSMTAFNQNGGGNGPVGPYKAFRLAAVVPAPVSVVGLKDNTIVREGSGETPCKYLSGPYEQFDGGTGAPLPARKAAQP